MTRAPELSRVVFDYSLPLDRNAEKGYFENAKMSKLNISCIFVRPEAIEPGARYVSGRPYRQSLSQHYNDA